MADTPLDIEQIEARAEKATKGPWVVIQTTHPYKFTPSSPEFKGEGSHIERRIATSWSHPQLKDRYPVVNISVGIGTTETRPVYMCSIDQEDADFIAAARQDVPSLCAEVRRLRAINATLMGNDEDMPRYTTKRLRDEIAQATSTLTTRNERLVEALKPFILEGFDLKNVELRVDPGTFKNIKAARRALDTQS